MATIRVDEEYAAEASWARTAVAGDYVYEWTEEDRESLSSHVGPSDSEMAGIRAALRTRDLTTATDDRGIRVVPRED